MYVSDYPGSHDFDLLKSLVLEDGTVLRSLLPGRPTRDCLFKDVLRDDKSLLKVRAHGHNVTAGFLRAQKGFQKGLDLCAFRLPSLNAVCERAELYPDWAFHKAAECAVCSDAFFCASAGSLS